MPHFVVWEPRGGAYDPQIRTRVRFLYSAPSHQVNRLEVFMLTNKLTDKQQTPLKTSTSLCYAMLVGKYSLSVTCEKRIISRVAIYAIKCKWVLVQVLSTAPSVGLCVCRLDCPVHCGKTADWIWMPFGWWV